MTLFMAVSLSSSSFTQTEVTSEPHPVHFTWCTITFLNTTLFIVITLFITIYNWLFSLFTQFLSAETSSPKATLPVIYCWYLLPSKLSVQSRYSVDTFARKGFLSGSILVNYIVLEDILCFSNFLKWVDVIFNPKQQRFWTILNEQIHYEILLSKKKKKKSPEYYVRRNLYTWKGKKSLCPVAYTVPNRNDKGSYTRLLISWLHVHSSESSLGANEANSLEK